MEGAAIVASYYPIQVVRLIGDGFVSSTLGAKIINVKAGGKKV